MEPTPKSLRIHLAIAGRVNSGKSTLFNLISGQDAAITSPERGTTTDVVEKTMELRPLGAIVLLDTAGTDDDSILGAQRNERTAKALDRADAILLVITANSWGEPEQQLAATARERKTPLLPIINLRPNEQVSAQFIAEIKNSCGTPPAVVCATDKTKRSEFLDDLTAALQEILPDDLTTPPLLRDLLEPGGVAVLMTPIDRQAPKGRLILPQIQAIRDVLDGDAMVITAKENAFPQIYSRLAAPPELVVCDSQAVKCMIATTPPGVKQTTFSILMARMKGDLELLAAGCAAISRLRPGAKVMIAESCTHHAGSDDIGRVKIPRLLEQQAGGKLDFSFASGADFPPDLAQYDLVVHCGGCMLNRKAMLNRLRAVSAAGVPVTNYGMCISYCSGVLETVLSPFPEALKSYRKALDKEPLPV
ncbi:MAG: [FeFe] hydrogenase H-cluster maturation GTPase HydF [Lentisphaerae bacterium]|nr:[FeFe] hydrogenase H-cluster maturation GTPase HydF [Lentisphaerota bacterium]